VQEQHRTTLPAFAWRPISVITSVLGVVLLVFSSRFGYFGDELYFIGAGRRLDVNFADQPPLVPLLANLLDEIGGGSLVVLRLPSVLMMMAGALVTRSSHGTGWRRARAGHRGGVVRDRAVLPDLRNPAGDLDDQPVPVDGRHVAAGALGARPGRPAPAVGGGRHRRRHPGQVPHRVPLDRGVDRRADLRPA
jgi:hypothetical protein